MFCIYGLQHTHKGGIVQVVVVQIVLLCVLHCVYYNTYATVATRGYKSTTQAKLKTRG